MVLVDREGRAGLDLGVSGVPESFAVDAMGKVVAKSSGPLLEDADVERLVGAMQAPPRVPPTATERSRAP
jgi:cytochrome c biogenesis protein CcmG/thiol:disulfide interchange protein DsbE